MGYVGYDQRWRQMRVIRHHLKGVKNPVVIAALHHHLHPIRSVRLTHFCQPPELREVSLTSDAFDILSALMRHGVELILHGHMHLDYRYWYGDWQNEQRSVVVAPVGSLSLSRASGKIPPGHGHQFQVIEIRDDEYIRVHVYSANLDKSKREWTCTERRNIRRGPGWAVRGGDWTTADNEAIAKIEQSKDDLARLELYACAPGFYGNDAAANTLLLRYIRTRWNDKFGDFDTAAAVALPLYREKHKSVDDMLKHLKDVRLDDDILELMRDVARKPRIE